MIRLAFQLAPMLVVTSAHLGTPTPSPTIQNVAIGLQFNAGHPAYPGQPVIAAKPASGVSPALQAHTATTAMPAVPSFAILTAGGQIYQIPSSQLSVLATQTVTPGPLSLTIVTGSGSTAAMLQFSLNSQMASFLISSAKTCLYSDTGVRGPFPVPNISLPNRAN